MSKFLQFISQSITYTSQGKIFDNDIIYSLPEIFFIFGFFVVFLLGIFKPKTHE